MANRLTMKTCPVLWTLKGEHPSFPASRRQKKDLTFFRLFSNRNRLLCMANKGVVRSDSSVATTTDLALPLCLLRTEHERISMVYHSQGLPPLEWEACRLRQSRFRCALTALSPNHALLIRHSFFQGFDIVKRISEIPTDEKSRPLQSVVISHCGELELRKVPPKAAPRKFYSASMR